MSRDRYRAWEWETRSGMQLRLAGDQPREEYLADRRHRGAWIVDQLGLTQRSSVLEIGSGEGVMAAALASKVRQMCCADVSTSFLDKARETCWGLNNVTFRLIEDDYLETLQENSFDAGYSLNVFIHLDAYEIFLYLRQIARLLRPGGRFTFNVLEPGEVTWPYFHGDLARYRRAELSEAKGMLTWHDRRSILGLASEAGLCAGPDDILDEGGVVYLTVQRPGRVGGRP